MPNHAEISKALDGDGEALSRVVAAYAPRVRAYFSRHGMSSPEITEALQETFVRALEAVSKKRIRRRTFEGWLFVTARNVRVNLVRAAVRDREIESDDFSEVCADPVPDPCEIQECRDAVHAAVERLPIHLRQCRWREAVSGAPDSAGATEGARSRLSDGMARVQDQARFLGGHRCRLSSCPMASLNAVPQKPRARDPVSRTSKPGF